VLSVVLALALLVPVSQSKPIILGERFGGFVKLHLDIADRWLRQGQRIVIRGDQWSAAALQVAYFASQNGRICATSGVRLHYHAPCNIRTRKCKGDPNKWITRTPAFVGIPTCNL
jgi:hypothetical protein